MNTEEYARMFAVEDTHWWYRALHTLVRQALRRHAPEARRIADIGCGTGAMAAQLADVARVIALDFSPEGLAFCQQRGLRQLARADAAHLPLGARVADTALLLDVLYHRNVAEPAVVLEEVHRILAPGGIVVVNVPAYQWLHSSHDVAVHTGRRFTRPAVNRLLEEAGFEIVQSSYWNTVLFPAIVAVRLALRALPNRGSDLSEDTSPLVNRAIGAIMALEHRIMWRFSLPFGLSIFVVARRGTDTPCQPERATRS